MIPRFYKITGNTCTFSFLTNQGQITVFVFPDTLVKVRGNSVSVLNPTTSSANEWEETIDYPTLVDTYVSRRDAVEVFPDSDERV